MRQVLTTGPLVTGEEHWAVLNAYADVVLLGEGDEWWPNFLEARPVVIDRLGPIAPDKRIDDTDVE